MNFLLMRKKQVHLQKKHNNYDKYNSHDKAFLKMTEYVQYTKHNSFNGNRYKYTFGGLKGESERE